ncbi:MAG: AraC family transcriptional regulator [Caulobacteraceae bacterium]
MTMLYALAEPSLGKVGDGRGVQGASQRREQLCGRSRPAEIAVTRWSDSSPRTRRETVVAADGECVLGVALTSARVRLISDQAVVFDGVMTSGMTYVCGPSQTLEAEYTGPADVLHLHLADPSIREALTARPNLGGHSVAKMLPRDSSIEHLAWAMLSAREGAHERYIETLAQAIAMRTTQIDHACGRVSPLPKWRLRQVITYIEAHLADAISLNDLAAVAGFSRAHFAVQFRLATGCTPSEFVQLQRIEAAKRMLLDPSIELIDVALSVGFQAQAHFSTVFKRYVGETPGRWRRGKLDEPPAGPEAAPMVRAARASC